MIGIAAAGDLHFGRDSAGTLRPHLEGIGERADVLLLAGDLTKRGEPEEARVLAREIEGVEVPVVAVLGNHDHHSDREADVAAILRGVGVTVLEGESAALDIGGERLGVVGAKGFGGGFAGACATDFGEREMKAFVRTTRDVAQRLEGGLRGLEADHRVVLLHYAPIKETLHGEPPEIYAFLGSYLLAESVDGVGADLVLHGHAHHGSEKGVTPGGIHVRNVAQQVIRTAYNVYCLGNGERASGRHLSDAARI
jgi:Icc-related predicted phosphoesterase